MQRQRPPTDPAGRRGPSAPAGVPGVRRQRPQRRRRQNYAARRLVAVLAVVLVVGPAAFLVDRITRTTPQPATEEVDITAPTTTTVPRFDNPVLAQDFPDPMVVATDDGFLAFATNSDDRNVQLSRSKDLATWSAPIDVLPTLPEWAHPESPDVWAPTWFEFDGQHLLFFSVRGATSERQCLGVATAPSIEGPYTPREDPLRCDAELGGSIDPFVFAAEDRVWLLWKNDGNCCGVPVWIRIAELDLATMTTTGPVHELITVDQDWEQGVVEAPELVRIDGAWHLFYSAARYGDESYGIGLAECASVTGPCRKLRSYPLLGTTGDVVGPGGQSVFTTPDRGWMIAYHAWDAPVVGYDAGGARALRIDLLDVSTGTPVVIGPS